MRRTLRDAAHVRDPEEHPAHCQWNTSVELFGFTCLYFEVLRCAKMLEMSDLHAVSEDASIFLPDTVHRHLNRTGYSVLSKP